MKYRLGCTPAWWQLLKALSEIGNDLIVVPFLGDAIESLWWRSYPNPCSWESKAYNLYLGHKNLQCNNGKEKSSQNNFINTFLNKFVKIKWENHIKEILKLEPDIGLLLFMNIPITHISGLSRQISSEYGIPVAYLEGDMPTILPKYARKRGFKFNYYTEADLSEFDMFFTNSKGVIQDLKEMGAKNVYILHYAADPELFKPISIEKDIDVSFYGHGSELREEWLSNMITIPSNTLNKYRFVAGGRDLNLDLGKAERVGYIPYGDFKRFCCRSKLCLNITRWSHTSVYASSTARPFELAAYGSCIVSQPYNGLEEWFDPGREIVVVNSKDEAMEAYRWLLADKASREEIGRRARERVLKEHTYCHRAMDVVKHINGGLKGLEFPDKIRAAPAKIGAERSLAG